ncbi:MotA/TolQ/ExbB proton channel family protein [Jiella avicenniae]|uniref:MotA/TolQ/ExbB proton channel family protein n=1 Tax=Jiella avicenniae TaxID=2907202 RepID=A0A9X1P3P9_9HYPH|nr:MotA/TolQ/ExbB proton channel family protein [Jiella avicenniae]MCE7027659.1 MotA/TolQ/ExbB proton channel family protein [Jiella avicenniae]MCE7028701.1 MotA/TolQ/ExbB proton channel family protein [Jiella avicenniae]
MWEILASQLSSSAGPILVVLALLSIAGLAVSIVKAVEFRRAGVGRSGKSRSFASDAGRATLLRAHVLAAAKTALAEAPPGPEGRERAGALAEEAAIEGLARLARHLPFLDAIVQAAPMLGLLGTVFGMIEVFFTMSGTQGAIDPALLSAGIFAALITTAAGLVVAIPFFFAAAYFDAALDAETRAIEGLILRAVHGDAPRSVAYSRRRLSTVLPDDEAASSDLDRALARPR